MKYGLLFLFLLMLCASCKFFETEKISSEEFLEEELKSISWNEVDSYPVFSGCDEAAGKAAQKDCFENTLRHYVEDFLKEKEMVSTQSLSSTIYMNITIDDSGKISVPEITGDSLTFQELPNLKMQLKESLESLPKTEPALKRGIPVNTRFSLPIVIKTE